MDDSTYQHICTLIMGIATLFRFIGYDLVTFIVESLLHSAHVRDSNVVMEHAGYYGQAVKEVSTCMATLIVPVVLNYASPKWTLVAGSSLFAIYFACFLFINNSVFFITNILLGIAIAMIYTSFYTYQMGFSTRHTLARNSARIQAIANLSLISGGLLYMHITATNATSTGSYRYYTESETKKMFGFLFAFCLINLVLTCCLPTREVENSESSENPKPKFKIGHQLTASASVLLDPLVILFIPRFVNHGLLVSFFMNVYPTSLQYSSALAMQYPMMTAYYAFAMCAGTTLSGLVVSPLNRCFIDFGLRPLYYIANGVQLVAYIIAVLTVPSLSTVRPTTESAPLEPRQLWVCVMAFLMGFADSAHVASGAVLCSRILPGRAAHAYSAARFYRGLGASVIFFCSSFLTMEIHAIILVTVTIISTLTFDFAVRKIEKRENNFIFGQN